MRTLDCHSIRGGLLLLAFQAVAAEAALTVELGSAEVDISVGDGLSTATLDVVFRNASTEPAPLAGYTLFLDVAPAGSGLPAGVSFADPAVTYLTGGGAPPLSGAGPGTINLAPAAGDLGLGQIQFADAMVPPGEGFAFLTVNLTVDRAEAAAGVFDVALAADGENTLDALEGPQPFKVIPGSLTLVADPALPGDFDDDFDVDGFDFLVWQRGQSPLPLGGSDLADWEANFAARRAPPDSLLITVPEPAVVVLILATLALAPLRPRFFVPKKRGREPYEPPIPDDCLDRSTVQPHFNGDRFAHC